MKNAPAPVPQIIEHIHPITEQFGPVSHNADQMQIPGSMKEVPEFTYRLLTKAEQAICDNATD